MGHQGFLWQWNSCIWYYNDEYISLNICPNSPKAQRQEWSLQWITDLGWWCCYRFISCNKCTSLVQEADSGEGCVCLGTQTTWELSILSAQFCCKCKIALKNKVFLKGKNTLNFKARSEISQSRVGHDWSDLAAAAEISTNASKRHSWGFLDFFQRYFTDRQIQQMH